MIAKVLIVLAGIAGSLATLAALEPHDAPLAAAVLSVPGWIAFARTVPAPLAGSLRTLIFRQGDPPC